MSEDDVSVERPLFGSSDSELSEIRQEKNDISSVHFFKAPDCLVLSGRSISTKHNKALIFDCKSGPFVVHRLCRFMDFSFVQDMPDLGYQ